MTATDAAPSANNGASRASYEELRRLALDGSVSDRHAALLMREGVVAWMSQRPVHARPVANPPRPRARVLVEDEMNEGIVSVLVNIALHHRQEMRV